MCIKNRHECIAKEVVQAQDKRECTANRVNRLALTIYACGIMCSSAVVRGDDGEEIHGTESECPRVCMHIS